MTGRLSGSMMCSKIRNLGYVLKLSIIYCYNIVQLRYNL